jgi:uncharacterized protein involved in exopolysaccharide biosynthesis
MEEEIDLRPYIQIIGRSWKSLSIITLLGILLGFIFSLIQTPNYEATAIIAITELRQDVVFDNRITSREDAQPLRGLPELAISDTMLLNLLEVLDIPFAQNMTVTHLRARIQP